MSAIETVSDIACLKKYRKTCYRRVVKHDLTALADHTVVNKKQKDFFADLYYIKFAFI